MDPSNHGGAAAGGSGDFNDQILWDGQAGEHCEPRDGSHAYATKFLWDCLNQEEPGEAIKQRLCNGVNGGDAGGSSGGSRGAVYDAAYSSSPAATTSLPLKSRAHWTPQNIKIFCQLYCDEIDKKNCPRGQMSKWGWKNLTEAYYKATKLVHDNITFGSRVRQLRILWNDLRKLQNKETGLGRNPDGSFGASNEWREQKDKDNKLKGAMPDYMDLLDRMFKGVAVTRETAYVPSRRIVTHYVSSDDEEDVHTPQSTSSKRSYNSISTRNSVASPSKRSKSPTVSENMRNLTNSLDNMIETMKEIWGKRKQVVQDKQKEKMSNIDLVMELAREAGATEDDERLWGGVLLISKNEVVTRVFLKSPAKGRMAIIKHYAEMVGQPRARGTDADDEDDEQWEEDFFNMFFDDVDEVTAILYGLHKEGNESQLVQDAEILKKMALSFHKQDMEMHKQNGLQMIPFVG